MDILLAFIFFLGLPAGSIKYGGQYIYWKSVNPQNFGVFAVNVERTSNLLVITSQSVPNFMTPLSPDQQPLPCMTLLPNTISHNIIYNNNNIYIMCKTYYSLYKLSSTNGSKFA